MNKIVVYFLLCLENTTQTKIQSTAAVAVAATGYRLQATAIAAAATEIIQNRLLAQLYTCEVTK